jgi:hypothetical protein
MVTVVGMISPASADPGSLVGTHVYLMQFLSMRVNYFPGETWKELYHATEELYHATKALPCY